MYTPRLVIFFAFNLSIGVICTGQHLLHSHVKKSSKDLPCTLLSDLDSKTESETLDAFTLYRKFFKEKNYNVALAHWRIAFYNAPAANGIIDYHFNDGLTMYIRKMQDENRNEIKRKYLDTIGIISSQRIKCLGDDLNYRERLAYHYPYFKDFIPAKAAIKEYLYIIENQNLETPGYIIYSFLSFWNNISIKDLSLLAENESTIIKIEEIIQHNIRVTSGKTLHTWKACQDFYNMYIEQIRKTGSESIIHYSDLDTSYNTESIEFAYIDPSELVGYYPFTLGATSDFSQNGNDAIICTNKNELRVSPGSDRNLKKDNALTFDGVDDMLRIKYNDLFSFDNNFTLNVWIYPLEVKSQTIIRKGNKARHSIFRLGLAQTDRKIVFAIDSDFRPYSVSYNGYILNQWQMITAVVDNDKMLLYLNGRLVGSELFVGKIKIDPLDILIGSRLQLWSSTFNGKLDDISIHTTALSKETIQNIYKNGL